jgi:predicted N-formylglutamate amidohydrolase
MKKLLLTCEHAGNRIPREYARLFAGQEVLVNSHRGWDPGALELIRYLSRSLHVPYHRVMWSRLLVESNRTPSNPRIWSKITKSLPMEEKQRILNTYWWPNRRAVEADVRREIAGKRKVIHIAIHSFTPELDGEVRNADVSLLYDPTRPSELKFCRQWEQVLCELEPTLRVRRNYPYRGRSDGLPTWLRKKFDDRVYIGIEFEMNQTFTGAATFGRLKQVIAESLRIMVGSRPFRTNRR